MADMEQEICDACDLTGTSEERGTGFDESNDKHPPFHRHYTLPILRYRNLVLLILFVDGVSTTALWLAGGHSEYLVDSIRDFHILHSVFDSVLITAVKVVLLWLLFTWLEDVTLSNLQAPYHTQLKRKTTFLHTLIFTTSAICLVYFVIKGSLILNEYIKNAAYEPMHITYSVVTVSTVCFSAIQVALSLLSVSAMRRLSVYRVLHRYNDDGDEVDETGKVIPKEATLKRVIALAKPELGIILAGIVFLFISSASTTASPFFFGLVIDAAIQSMDKLNKTVIYLCVIYAVTSVATFLRSYLFTLAGQRFVARLRKQLFASIIKQDIAFFDETRTGELTNRLSSDTTVIQNAVTVNISMLARYILEIIGSLVVMFILNPALTGVLLAVVPIISVAAVQYGAFLKKLQQKFQDCLATASATAEENISSIRTVRSFYGERKANVDYGDNIDQSYAIGKKLAFIQGAFSGVLGVLANGAIALLLWYGGKLLNEKVLTVGIITSFLLYTLQVAMAFAFLSSLYGDFMKAVGASVRIFELLDKKPVVGGEKNLISPTDFDRSITFDSVRFTYPSRPESQVLKDVSFSVASGQMIALVGPSGGGKSTIVSLIERFYDPESGSITLGGHELSTLSQEYFRQRVAMVAQEPVLFACSIKQNITYGKPASMEEVIEVAKQANAHDFIMSFDDQYDTVVGEKGVRLSGGQKQRIAIARALMVDPTILLLDEATSALDAESEHLVQQAIDNAMQNRTVLVIAHRLSTVRNAHKVIVINKGTIVEQGTHSELISMDGVYKKLVLRQLEAAKNTDLIEFS